MHKFWVLQKCKIKFQYVTHPRCITMCIDISIILVYILAQNQNEAEMYELELS